MCEEEGQTVIIVPSFPAQGCGSDDPPGFNGANFPSEYWALSDMHDTGGIQQGWKVSV
jgi:hypothetical protein